MALQGRSRRRSVFVLTVLTTLAALAAGAIAIIACSDQGEGERCDRRAENQGSNDCNSGLVCTAAGELNGATTTQIGEGRCCPVDRQTATTVVCSRAPAPAGGDAAPPPETGAPAVTDGGSDAEGGPDTGAEGGLDAALESGADTGPDAKIDGDAAGD